jgi:hypothetical protein
MNSHEIYTRAELLINLAKPAADVEKTSPKTPTIAGMSEIIVTSLKKAHELLIAEPQP